MEKRIASARRFLKTCTETQVIEYHKLGREYFGASQKEYF
jgi:hypothetical protein